MNNDFLENNHQMSFDEREVRGWVDCPECPPPPTCNSCSCQTPPPPPCKKKCCKSGGSGGPGPGPASEVVDIEEIESFLSDLNLTIPGSLADPGGIGSMNGGQGPQPGGGGGQCGDCKNCADLFNFAVHGTSFLPPKEPDPNDPNPNPFNKPPQAANPVEFDYCRITF